MKQLSKPLLLLLTAFVFVNLFASKALAQKFEFSADANTGLFNYTGNGTVKQTYYFDNQPVQNRYGQKLTLSYGASLQGQYVSKSGFIAGLNAGYNFLRSKINFSYPPTPNASPAALYAIGYYPSEAGHAIITNQYLDLNPYFGCRFRGQKSSVDFSVGIEYGVPVSTKQTAHINSPKSTKSVDIDDLQYDTRIKGGVAYWYKKFGISASYAGGIHNFQKEITYNGSTPEVHSQLIKFGINYKIN